MKKVFFLAALAATTVACNSTNYTQKAKLKNQVDSVSYSMGLLEGANVPKLTTRHPFDTIDVKSIAMAFAVAKGFEPEYKKIRFQQFDSLSFEPFMYGFIHSATHQEPQISSQMADIILQGKYEMVRQAELERQAAKAEENKAAGKAFLEENAKKEGVKVLESGVQYRVIEAGAGAPAGIGKNVKVNYEGKTIDGTIFDSSYERNEPFSVRTDGGVIAGWQQILQIMPAGAKWEVFIPADQGYGDQTVGEIEAGSTLIFTIEMLEIAK